VTTIDPETTSLRDLPDVQVKLTDMFADEPAAKAVEVVDPLAIIVFVESKRTT
jgi:hypothetical protein